MSSLCTVYRALYPLAATTKATTRHGSQCIYTRAVLQITIAIAIKSYHLTVLALNFEEFSFNDYISGTNCT